MLDSHFATDHLKNDLRGRAVRGGVTTVVGQGAQFIIQMTSTIVLARLLTPDDFGLVGMVTVVMGFIALLRELGLSQATVQRDHITHTDISTLFWLNIAAGVILALVTAALAPILAWFYGDHRLTRVALVLATGFIFSGVATQSGALLRRQMRFTALTIADLTALVTAVGAAIFLAARGGRYWAIVAQMMIFSASQATMVWILSGWRPGRPALTPRVREMLTFGANLVGFDLLNYFARNADNFLIGWRWGQTALGLYSKAYGLLLQPLRQINSPVSAVAIPLLSRLATEPDRYRRAYRSATDIVNLATMPGIAVLIVTSDWIVAVVLGPRWMEASHIFVYLGFASLVQPLANSTGWLFVSQARTGEMARWGLYSSPLITLSFVIGLPWGPRGVAIAYSLCILCVIAPLLFSVVGSRGPVSTRDLYDSLRLPAGAVVSILVAVGGLRFWGGVETPWYGLALALPLSAAVTIIAYVLPRRGRTVLADMARLLRTSSPHAVLLADAEVSPRPPRQTPP